MTTDGNGAALDVVVLVASAGGLAALSAVLGDLPADLPAAVVVQQHLGGSGSSVTAILQRRIGRPVAWAVDGGILAPGTVVVAPPRRRLELYPDGTCALHEVPLGARELPHDALLQSLADSYGARGLAVVLTGLGKDGAAGVAAVKAAGGTVLAQDVATAEHPSMPQAAADAGADLVLALHEIGRVIGDVARGAPLPRPEAELEAVQATFGEVGDVAAVARDTDWSLHPLGPVREWPALLRSTVRLCLDSPGPAGVYWGAELLWFGNDAFVAASGKAADVVGRPYAEVNSEVWHDAEPLLRGVLAGAGELLAASMWTQVRDGRLRNRWYDAWHSPIRWLDGAVAGISVIILERTDDVLAARRLGTVNALAGSPVAESRREALQRSLAVLGRSEDVAFAAVYELNGPAGRASLVGATGIEEGGPMAPHNLSVRANSTWPLRDVDLDARSVRVGDLASRFRGHRVGADELAVEDAELFPLHDGVDGGAAGVLVMGLHPRLVPDVAYRDFLTLIGDTVAAKASEAEARQRDRRRTTQLRELDRAKTEFFTNVSHEFRTPLTLMLGPLEGLLQRPGDLPPDTVDDLRLAHRNAQRLLQMVGSLLDFSQSEAGRLRLRFAPVDLAKLTADIASTFRGAAESAGLALEIDVDALPEPVWVDAGLWEKIVANLVSNALKFTWEGSVQVNLRALPKHVELTVRDTGVGIPDEELAHVFRRFHRVQGSRGRTHEGAGIGLALVHELVRRHLGRVRVTSKLGRGTTFTVWLPLGRRPVGEDHPPENSLTAVEATGSVAAAMAAEAERWDPMREALEIDGPLDRTVSADELRPRHPGARVLVADDNPDMRDYLVRLLGPFWDVAVARDGADALARLRHEPPDLLLADVMMPELDGFALLREVRADPGLAELPVVLLTARAGEESAIEGLLAGADDYVVKPFSARELAARVGAQLELGRLRRRMARDDAYRVELTDALRSLRDTEETLAAAARVLARHLEVDRVFYVRADEPADGALTVHIGPEYTRENDAVAGVYDVHDVDPGILEAHHTGETLVVPDSTRYDVNEPTRANWIAMRLGAFVAVPIVRHGQWVGVLDAAFHSPHEWTAAEVALIEETAERTWTFVERAEAERALRVSEAQLRRATELTGLGVFEWDLATDRATVDPVYRAVFGLSADHPITGEDMLGAVIHPGDRAGLRSAIASCQERFDVQFRALTPRGEVWVRAVADVRFIEDGEKRRAVHIAGNVLDITAAKHTELALRAANDRLGQQFRAVAGLADLAGQTVWTAEAGASPAWLAAVHPDDREDAEHHWHESVAAETAFDTRLRLRGDDGWQPTQVRGVPLHDPDGILHSWAGLNTDLEG